MKNSNIAKEHGYEKNDIVLELTSSLDSKSTILTNAQDLLASRAAAKFITLMDKYAPESVKNSTEYVEELNKYFNLGESSELKEQNFKSKFGQGFVREYEKNEIYSEYANPFTPEDMTMQFLASSISSEAQQNNIDEIEKNMGISQVVKMINSLSVEKKHNTDYSIALEKDYTSKFENN